MPIIFNHKHKQAVVPFRYEGNKTSLDKIITSVPVEAIYGRSVLSVQTALTITKALQFHHLEGSIRTLRRTLHAVF